MKTAELINTATALMGGDKGLLAMDESTGTCNKRFEEAGIPPTIEYRRAYRELIVTTPNLGDCISGAILYDETIYQSTDKGVLFIDILKKDGIIPGIKVDEGTVNMAGFPGEKVTEGIDGLRERLEKYYDLGARFAKWRAVINIDQDLPTKECIETNMHLLARYAALCQENGIVPIVEPEVLMDGDHSLKRCQKVTGKVLKSLFKHLEKQRVDLRGIILKPNMVLPGLKSEKQAGIDKVAKATVTTLLKFVPPAVAGVAFLSGGQSPQLAAAHLNAMHVIYKGKLPWALTFSFARAIQQPAMDMWKGLDKNVKGAQKLLYKRASLDCAARRGEYTADMEGADKPLILTLK